MARKVRPTAPVMEMLESRTLLSGTVLVTYSPKSVTIKGDAADNSIFIDGLNGYSVMKNDADTQVIESGVKPTPSQTVNLKIDMGAGNNSVELRNLVTGKVDLKAGVGDDSIAFNYGCTFWGAVKVNLGAGNNLFAIYNDICKANVTYNGGIGADHVILSGTYMGAVAVNTGAGDDLFETGATAVTVFAAPVKVSLGAGNDTVALGGNLTTSKDVTFNSTAVFDFGAGDDKFNANVKAGANIKFAKTTSFLFGQGADTTDGITAGALQFQDGSGLIVKGGLGAKPKALQTGLLTATFGINMTMQVNWS